MIRKRTSLILITIIIILVIPHAVSAGLVNFGAIDLKGSLLNQDIFSIYPLSEIKLQTEKNFVDVGYFALATEIDNKNKNAYWMLGRVALLTGNYSQAADTLVHLEREAVRQPLLYHDLIAALSHTGRDERVIDFHEKNPHFVESRFIQSNVVLAYLNLSQRRDEKEAYLEQVIELRPGNLYANYLLWQQALENKDAMAEEVYRQKLTDFPMESLTPADPRLLGYVRDVIPQLLSDSLWNKEKTLDVISFLVWKYYDDKNVLQLVKDMIDLYPAQPEWQFYLAEYYHRGGSLKQAQVAYQHVLEIDPEYPQAEFRLSAIANDNQTKIIFFYPLISDESSQALTQKTKDQCLSSESIIFEAEKMPRLIGEVMYDSQATGSKAVYSGLEGGFLSYGPYISLPRGVYQVVYRVKLGEHRQGNSAIFDVNDLSAGALNQFPTWKVEDIQIAPHNYQDIVFLFENYLYSGGKQMEFRTQVSPQQEFWLDYIRLCRVDSDFDG